MRNLVGVVVVVFGAVLGSAGIGHAQPRGPAQQLLPNTRANFGTRIVQPGFTPDPMAVNVVSGGAVDVNRLNIGPGCTGYASQSPDFNFTLTGYMNFLRIYVDAVQQEDTTLVINKPDGTWACNDDAFGHNPEVDFTRAMPGVYNIWVGSYRANVQAHGRLTFTQNMNAHPGGGVQPQPVPVPVPMPGPPPYPQPPPPPAGLSFNANPNYGTRSFNPNFMPDPVTINVVSGGRLDVRAMGLAGCTGFVSSAPDFIFMLNGWDQFLRVFVDSAQEDTTLVINRPDGSWACADDTYGNNPGVDFNNAQPGMYRVWVGSYRARVRAHGTLNITEIPTLQPGAYVQLPIPQPGPQPMPPPQYGLNIRGPANYGSATINPHFMPDPLSTRVTSGGNLDARRMGLVGAACSGFVSSNPDFSFTLTGYDRFLRVFVDAGTSDTTLVINKPDGSWACDDDTFGNNPSVDFNGAAPGTYAVWVGSYRANQRLSGTLNITELPSAQPGVQQYAPQQQYPQQQYPQQQYPQQPAGASGLNFRAPPNFGTQPVEQGFVPDPISVRVTAGGMVAASMANIPAACTGYVNLNPDINLMLNTTDSFLRVYVNNTNGADTTLVVRTPDGRWFCNDDAYGNNPSVDMENVPGGMINVWVGSYRAGVRANAVVNVTEMQSNHP
ncbi:MAG: PPC domain-containing protein [Sandaracinaceae bacterium]|jgi:hypothetical protein|nr:PPC domain-containing protein [Sandaracinaceae bacterium]